LWVIERFREEGVSIEGTSYLDLENNLISTISDSIGNLTNLNYLYLDNNQISEIPKTMGSLTNLVELSLRNNRLCTVNSTINNWLNTYGPDWAETQYSDSAHIIKCDVTVKVESKQSSNETTLTVSPDPFNPSTTISFPNPNHDADILIYDIKGREVKRFTNIKSNRVSWDASSLSAGIYQVRVKANSRTYTKAISLIK